MWILRMILLIILTLAVEKIVYITFLYIHNIFVLDFYFIYFQFSRHQLWKEGVTKSREAARF